MQKFIVLNICYITHVFKTPKNNFKLANFSIMMPNYALTKDKKTVVTPMLSPHIFIINFSYFEI